MCVHVSSTPSSAGSVRPPLRAGTRLSLEHTTSTVRATLQELHSRLDPETLDEHDRSTELALNDIGSITLRLSPIVIADKYTENRDAGAFILINELSNDRVRVGVGVGVGQRFTSPQFVDQAIDRYHLAARDQQSREHAALARTAEIAFAPIVRRGERAEYPDPNHDAPSLGRPPCSALQVGRKRRAAQSPWSPDSNRSAA